MLFFEVFPAFVALIAIVVGIGLFFADRQARQASAAAHDDSL